MTATKEHRAKNRSHQRFQTAHRLHTRKRLKRNPSGTTQILSYTSNNAHQMTQVQSNYAGVTVNTSYGHDANGNRASRSVNGVPDETYTYDALNRMSGFNGSSYGYDDQGRRIRKNAEAYLYDGQDIYAAYTASSGWGQPVRRTLHGPGVDDPVMIQAGAAKSYLHADGQGSVGAATATSGATVWSSFYDAWGGAGVTATAADAAIPVQQYTGRENDGGGLYYYRARYYDPGNGRFTQRDPIGLASGQVNPYSYVGNDPVNFTDPNGLAAMQVAGGILGGIGGVLFQGGVDLISGKLSSLQTYVGAAAGGVAGGVAATLCGPACAGAAAGAANNLAIQAMAGNGFSGTSLLIETGVGAVGGKIIGALLPPVAKTQLSTAAKGEIGEAMSALGLAATGERVVGRHVENKFGKSTWDFEVGGGAFVESKFGTGHLSSQQRRAQKVQDVEVHYWDYETVSGIVGAGPAAVLGNLTTQSLGEIASETPQAPYAGSATSPTSPSSGK